MRLSSKIVILFLFSSACLSAQSVNSSAQFTPPSFSGLKSCPVNLTIDRRPEGAVIWTGALVDWVKGHASLSLEEQQHALADEPGFHDLSPQVQQDRLNQLAAIYSSIPPHHAKGLSITIEKPAASIVSADVVVYGYPAGMQAFAVGLETPKDVTQSFHLTALDGHPRIDSAIWTERMAMITRIELTRVAYADGITWQPTPAAQCSASPSLYVPVNATATR